jgi:hypothetical protein
MCLDTVADSGFYLGLDIESLGGPNGDQRDWKRGGDQRDGWSAEISEIRQASRWLASGKGASKFVIPESSG